MENFVLAFQQGSKERLFKTTDISLAMKLLKCLVFSVYALVTGWVSYPQNYILTL